MLLTMMIAMLFFLLLGFPMMVPLISATMIAFIVFIKLDPTIIIQQMIGGVSPAALVAIPMFIFAAEIITAGQSAKRILDFIASMIGHVKGGMAITTAVSCALFGSVSGSTQATVCAIGGTMRPKLISDGYSSSFSTALIINSSDIAFLIPPSIGMIIYGVLSGTSISELFIAGIGPGILIMLLISLYCYIYSTRNLSKLHLHLRREWKERYLAAKSALLTFGFPILIMGGIYGGIFSPTEASAVAVLYAFILEVLIYRSVKFSQIFSMALSTGIVTAVIFILIGAGVAFSWVISFARIPSTIIPVILGSDPSNLYILFVISICFFVGCMFVDPVVVLMILTPILHPVAVNAGIDPVLVGTIVTLQVAIGSATPPFGCDIFTAIAVFRRPYFETIKGSPPFVAILLSCACLLIFYPQLALFLRDLAFY